MKNARALLACAPVLLVAPLSACGGDGAEASAARPTVTAPASPSASSSASPSASPSASAGATPSASAAAPAADLTAPGTRLAIGAAATLPQESSGATGTFVVRLDAIERGTEAELAELQLGDGAAGSVPYYLRYTVTGGANAAALRGVDPLSDVDALLPDGSRASGVILFQRWERCLNGDQTVDFTEGSTYTACRVVLAPASVPVTSARFSAYDTAYDPYDGQPVTWG